MTIPNHDAYLLPPDPVNAPCRNCSHYGDDHEQDGTCLARVTAQRWHHLDGTPQPYAKTVPCDCEGYEPRTLDDQLSDEADREYSLRKEGL